MSDGGGQLQHPDQRASHRAHVDGDPVGSGKGVRQNLEFFTIDANSLGGSVANLLDMSTHFLGGETALGCHVVLTFSDKRSKTEHGHY